MAYAHAQAATGPMCGHVIVSAHKPEARRPFARDSTRAAFDVTRGYRLLGPRPQASYSHDFHMGMRYPLLWTRLPPNDFCNYIRRTDTPSSTRFSPVSRRSIMQRPRIRSRFYRCLSAAVASPVEEGPRKQRAATAFSNFDPTALHAYRRVRTRKSSPDRSVACGQRSNPATACGGGR